MRSPPWLSTCCGRSQRSLPQRVLHKHGAHNPCRPTSSTAAAAHPKAAHLGGCAHGRHGSTQLQRSRVHLVTKPRVQPSLAPGLLPAAAARAAAAAAAVPCGRGSGRRRIISAVTAAATAAAAAAAPDFVLFIQIRLPDKGGKAATGARPAAGHLAAAVAGRCFGRARLHGVGTRQTRGGI